MAQPTDLSVDSSPAPAPPGSSGPRWKWTFLHGLRQDAPASLVVFLVALPLSLGIAAASGAPVMAGLIAAAVGGIVAGALGGSPLQVSGPAAGLTVVVAGLVEQFGWAVTCAITAAAGVVQLLLGLSRAGRLALAVSPVVVRAMLAGIGVTIVLQQLQVLLGSKPAGSPLENLARLPEAITNVELHSALLGLLVIGLLVAWKHLPAAIRRVPGPLVAVVAGTAVSIAFAPGVERITFSGSVFDAVALPQLPGGSWATAGMAVISVALIASIESLLSAVAVDKMHTGPRTDLNRELMGQGSANIVSGMLGGLPVTGVIVRSATNVEAGARTRKSAVLHGVWILVFSALFAGLIQLIPLTVLAGLLIVIGTRLIKVADIKTSLRTGEIGVYAVTLLCVIFLNLLEGVMIGLALAAAFVLWRVLRASIHALPSPSGRDSLWRVTISGSCSFFALPRLNRVLHSIPEGTEVLVELSADYVDHAFHEALIAWKKQHTAAGGSVLLEEHGNTAFEDAADNTPQRQEALELPLQPRANRQSAGIDDLEAAEHLQLRSILLGVDKYHRRHADKVLPLIQDLAEGQNPDTLFVACVDSRVNPNLITSSGPGDLLTLRNIGNVVCNAGEDDSIEAALSFALTGLGIESIVICGHSNCGAMKAVIDDVGSGSVPEASGLGDAFNTWLDHARPSHRALLDGHPVAAAAAAAGYSRLDQLGMVNVAMQLRKLEDHPLAGPALVKGQLQATGLFFDITTARVILITTDGIQQLDGTAPLSRTVS